MDTTVVKLLLAVAILFVLWKTMNRRGAGGLMRLGGGGSVPRPYDPREFYGDDSDDEEEDVVDDAEDEDDDYAEDDTDDEAEDEDDDYEDDEDDYEDDEDDYEEDYAEGYAQPLLSASAALLPKPESRFQNFSEFAPKALKGQNFLDASKYIGVNTQGSSLRNANYDLRAAPSIPRKQIGPWSQSTIDPDPYRKPLE